MKSNNSTHTETKKADLTATMTREAKRKAVVEDYKARLPRKFIAEKHGVPESTVTSWARQAGCPQRPRGSQAATTPSDRDQQILARLKEGESVDDVAKVSSVSRATIYNVLTKWKKAGLVEPPVKHTDTAQTPTKLVDVPPAVVPQEAAAPNPAVSQPSDLGEAIPPVVTDVVPSAGDHETTVEILHEPPESAPLAAASLSLDTGVVEAADDLDPGPFPVAALNPVLRRIVEETASVHSIAVELPGMAAVATIAGALGKGWHCVGAVNGRATFGNLFVVAGARQSAGKGVTEDIVRPLRAASDERAERFCREERPKLLSELLLHKAQHKRLIGQLASPEGCTMTESAREREMEGLVRLQVRIAEIEGLVKSAPSYLISNVTTAALTDSLARNGQVLMSSSPEAAELVRVALGKFNRRGGADFDVYLSGLSVESYGETRVVRGDTKLHPCITLLWLCQPCIVEDLMGNPEAQERGFVARCLKFVVEAGEIPLDDGAVRSIPLPVQRDWDTLVQAILAARGQAAEPNVITCTPEARKVFTAFHNESVQLRNGAYRDVEGQLGRWRENAIRIAVGQCVSDAFASPVALGAPLVLTEEQARRAVELARWCCRSGLKVQAASRLIAQRDRCDRLCKLLTNHGGKMTVRDLKDRHSYKEAEVKVVAQAFPDRLELMEVRPPVGRPSRVLVLRTNLGT